MKSSILCNPVFYVYIWIYTAFCKICIVYTSFISIFMYSGWLIAVKIHISKLQSQHSIIEGFMQKAHRCNLLLIISLCVHKVTFWNCITLFTRKCRLKSYILWRQSWDYTQHNITDKQCLFFGIKPCRK